MLISRVFLQTNSREYTTYRYILEDQLAYRYICGRYCVHLTPASTVLSTPVIVRRLTVRMLRAEVGTLFLRGFGSIVNVLGCGSLTTPQLECDNIGCWPVQWVSIPDMKFEQQPPERFLTYVVYLSPSS